MNRHARRSLLLFGILLAVSFGALSRAEDVGTLRASVDDLVREGKYEEATGRLQGALREGGNEELRQYALLELGEIRLIYQRDKEAAIAPLEDLVTDYLPASPYVQKAHYHLGSIYVEKGEASKAFQHLRRVDERSGDHNDAILKLDWAARNLKSAVLLPIGVKLDGKVLGWIAMALDLLFTFIWVTQTIFSRWKTSLIWTLLLMLVVAKLAASWYMQSLMTIYS